MLRDNYKINSLNVSSRPPIVNTFCRTGFKNISSYEIGKKKTMPGSLFTIGSNYFEQIEKPNENIHGSIKNKCTKTKIPSRQSANIRCEIKYLYFPYILHTLFLNTFLNSLWSNVSPF